VGRRGKRWKVWEGVVVIFVEDTVSFEGWKKENIEVVPKAKAEPLTFKMVRAHSIFKATTSSTERSFASLQQVRIFGQKSNA
jgi:hypothetical protein